MRFQSDSQRKAVMARYNRINEFSNRGVLSRGFNILRRKVPESDISSVRYVDIDTIDKDNLRFISKNTSKKYPDTDLSMIKYMKQPEYIRRNIAQARLLFSIGESEQAKNILKRNR